jgi:phosphoribosylformylglycinamidine cyclo-ligase
VPRHKIIQGARVKPGDVVIGLHSSGLHSNGYSLVRKVVEKSGMALGKHIEEFGCTLGEELLKPTKIYVNIIREICSEYKVKRVIKALAHITGGGLPANVPRVIPGDMDVVFHRKSWQIPPIFDFLQNIGEVDTQEMYHVFNMGIGMSIIVPPYYADAIVRRIRKMKWGADIVGEVVSGQGSVKFD